MSDVCRFLVAILVCAILGAIVGATVGSTLGDVFAAIDKRPDVCQHSDIRYVIGKGNWSEDCCIGMDGNQNMSQYAKFHSESNDTYAVNVVVADADAGYKCAAPSLGFPYPSDLMVYHKEFYSGNDEQILYSRQDGSGGTYSVVQQNFRVNCVVPGSGDSCKIVIDEIYFCSGDHCPRIPIWLGISQGLRQEWHITRWLFSQVFHGAAWLFRQVAWLLSQAYQWVAWFFGEVHQWVAWLVSQVCQWVTWLFGCCIGWIQRKFDWLLGPISVWIGWLRNLVWRYVLLPASDLGWVLARGVGLILAILAGLVLLVAAWRLLAEFFLPLLWVLRKNVALTVYVAGGLLIVYVGYKLHDCILSLLLYTLSMRGQLQRSAEGIATLAVSVLLPAILSFLVHLFALMTYAAQVVMKVVAKATELIHDINEATCLTRIRDDATCKPCMKPLPKIFQGSAELHPAAMDATNELEIRMYRDETFSYDMSSYEVTLRRREAQPAKKLGVSTICRFFYLYIKYLIKGIRRAFRNQKWLSAKIRALSKEARSSGSASLELVEDQYKWFQANAVCCADILAAACSATSDGAARDVILVWNVVVEKVDNMMGKLPRFFYKKVLVPSVEDRRKELKRRRESLTKLRSCIGPA